MILPSGEYDRNRPENEEQQFRVKKVFVHPKFDSRKNLNNDIALLQLDGAAERTNHVNTVGFLCELHNEIRNSNKK